MKYAWLPIAILAVLCVVVIADWGRIDEPSQEPALPSSSSATVAAGETLTDNAADAAARTTGLDIQRTDVPANAAQEETTAFTLSITTKERFGPSGTLVPNIPCEFGVGYGKSKWRGPPPRERLSFGIATSDTDGQITVQLNIPNHYFDSAATDKVVLWGRTVAAGLQHRYNTTLLPLDGSTKKALQVSAIVGATLSGSVFHADGTAAEDAVVRLLRKREDKDQYRIKGETRSDAEGHFEMHTEASGAYHLLAKKDGSGTASLRDQQLILANPPQNLTLILSGDGMLAGHLYDPVGNPVRNYEIWACPAAVPDQWVGYFHRPVQLPFELEGAGLYDEHLTTDEQGAFRFAGLRQGAYIIRGKTGATGYYQRVLTMDPVQTGRLDLVLQVKRYQLIVQVRDVHGETIKPKLMHSTERILQGASIYCAKSDASGRVLDKNPYPRVDRAWSEAGEVIFEVEAGQIYALGVISERAPLHEEVVAIQTGNWLTKVNIQLQQEREAGQLLIRPQQASGQPLGEIHQIEISSPTSGFLISEAGDYYDAASFEATLAAGDYVVLVDAEPWRGHHGARVDDKHFERVITPVVLRSGQRTELDLILAEGGHFEVNLQVDGEPDFSLWPRLSAGAWHDSERLYKQGARIQIFPLPYGNEITPSFELPIQSPLSGTYEGDWVANGETTRSHSLLSVGSYLLIAEVDGFPPTEKRFHIEAAETTHVKVVVNAVQ